MSGRGGHRHVDPQRALGQRTGGPAAQQHVLDGARLGQHGIGIGERACIIGLPVLCEARACTASGLIDRWSEVFPAWGAVPTGAGASRCAAVVPAALGATALAVLWTVLTFLTQVMGRTITGERLPADFPTRVGGLQALSVYVCHTPLLLLGPAAGRPHGRLRSPPTTAPRRRRP
ncbi:hypothetical protein [Streptomyces sp. NPDC046759]|uniref:hypothetical protein n=1 Tax=Streptomyces sp. NPDC046759 TaxID=3155019 RepID=UPI0033DA7652